MRTVSEILTESGSDKNTTHTYGGVYDAIFPESFRNQAKRVIEIGVYFGQSLKAWCEVFPNADVVGIDITPVTAQMGSRSFFLQADATKLETVESIKTLFKVPANGVDLIIDDGSHVLRDQIATAFLFRPFLSDKGIYVVEDMQTTEEAECLAGILEGAVIDRRGMSPYRYDDLLVVFGNVNYDVIERVSRVPVSVKHT